MKSDLPYAVVMGMSRTAYGIIRSLGEEGIPIISFQAAEKPAVFSDSKYIERNILVPDNEGRMLSSLVESGEQFNQRPIILVDADWCIKFLDTHREELEPHYDLPLSERYSLGRELDKEKMLKIARRAEAAVPETVTVTKDTVTDNGFYADLPFPVILKPSTSLIGKKRDFQLYNSADDLRKEIGNKLSNLESFVLQEYITGGEDALYETCGLVVDGQPFVGYMLRKLKQSPSEFGPTFLGETTWREDLLGVSEKMLTEISTKEGIHFEFKYDKARNKQVFLEVNYRYPATIYLATTAGVNLPAIRYWAAVDIDRAKELMTKKQKVGVRWVKESGYWQLLARGDIDPVEHQKTLEEEVAFSLFDINDLTPFLNTVRGGTLNETLLVGGK